jgi:heptosyltransferase-3
MKILCLQLARFGDIYQTWPVLKALKRVHPNAKIDLVVRERFRDATVGLKAVQRVHVFNTQNILAPLLGAFSNTSRSIEVLSDFLSTLKDENYDLILNLSFSPASSYLTELLTSHNTVVKGYTRHKDGYFNTPDDASAYFYAQVGVERRNRIHLTDLFALIAGVELEDSDFAVDAIPCSVQLPERYMVLHLGASQKAKTCTQEKWGEIIASLRASYSGAIVCVGAAAEMNLAPESSQVSGLGGPIVNLLGQTKLSDLFGILSKAELVIGCDSVALHIASLVQTPTLNLSFRNVRFWETGPRAAGSRVLFFGAAADVDAKLVAEEARRMLAHEAPSAVAIERIDGFGVIFNEAKAPEGHYAWELIRALYMNHQFPISHSSQIQMSFQRLGELAHLALENLKLISDPTKNSVAVGILNEVDSLIEYVGQLVPDIQPVVRWFQAEKLRIGPSSIQEIVSRTESLFQTLSEISQIYSINQNMNENMNREGYTWKS